REAALVGAAGGGREQRVEAQQDRDQLLGVTGLLEQVGEGREGLGCVRRERCPAARRRQQRLAVRGRREPVHEVRNQLGEALHRGGRGLADGRLDQRRSVADHRRGPRRPGPGGGAARVRLEGRADARGRGGRVAARVEVQLARRREQGRATGRGRLLGGPFEGGREIVEPLELAQHPLEGGERARVARQGRERALVRLGGGGRVVEPLLVQLAQPQQPRRPLGGCAAARGALL